MVTPMFSVVAMKSRTFSSLPCSAPEQAYRSWEGAQPGSQPRLAEGDVPHQGCHDQFISGVWLGVGQESFPFSFSVSLNPLWCRSLNLSGSLVFFWEFCEICDAQEFQVPWLLLRDWLQTGCWAVRR